MNPELIQNQHMPKTLSSLNRTLTRCTLCPRLVAWREQVGEEKVARYRDEEYWAKPVPGFGDPDARLLLIGLAPGAHGSNRTGRMFTGDRSGDWLFRALYRAGFANQPTSIGANDGLKLKDCYITASARCAPPGNKPTPEELANCRPYLRDELHLLKHVRVVVGLGKIGCDTSIDAFRLMGMTDIRTRIKFKHGLVVPLNETITLIASFHPSQQNTFTGRLTEPMFDSIFAEAKRLL